MNRTFALVHLVSTFHCIVCYIGVIFVDFCFTSGRNVCRERFSLHLALRHVCARAKDIPPFCHQILHTASRSMFTKTQTITNATWVLVAQGLDSTFKFPLKTTYLRSMGETDSRELKLLSDGMLTTQTFHGTDILGALYMTRTSRYLCS